VPGHRGDRQRLEAVALEDLARGGEQRDPRAAAARVGGVAELAPAAAIDSNPAWRAHADASVDIPEATHEDLRWADGYAFGTPTRYGNVSSQLKQSLDVLAAARGQGERLARIAALLAADRPEVPSAG
jgi:NAD(P)H dehydrogenase (quinone)